MNLYIFRRDLRLADNLALNTLINSKITPIFIYDPEQINKENNAYFSNKSVQFLSESLEDLNYNITHNGGTLHFFYGNTELVIEDSIFFRV